MGYRQLTSEERYMIARLKWQGYSQAEIGRLLGRHRSTISREVRRNATTHDGSYRPSKADRYARVRRSRSRRNLQFGAAQLQPVYELLTQFWSPEQISGWLRKERKLQISHETIYRYVWSDRAEGGTLSQYLRGSPKQKRKRYRSYDSRGILAGKRSIEHRPESIENRSSFGHWEIDTVMGSGDQHCLVTLVERSTGYVLIGKLRNRTSGETAKRTIHLIRNSGLKFKTITSDNGTEFHSYKEVEQATGVKYYFAHPYHSWERGSNENVNGLIRQYAPKRHSMKQLTQWGCRAIADALNSRPRKRYDWRTPNELVYDY